MKGNLKLWWKYRLQNDDNFARPECFKAYYQVTFLPVLDVVGLEVLYELRNWAPRQQDSFI